MINKYINLVIYPTELSTYGYLRKIKGFALTKGLSSHIRRKLQIINYFENKKIVFDYEKCLSDVILEKEQKDKLKKLYNYYIKRKRLPKKETQDYYEIAEKLAKRIAHNNFY